MPSYFIDGGPGMYLITAFAAVSLTLSTLQLVGPEWELRGFVWGAVGVVPGIGILLLSPGIARLLAALGQAVPEQADRLLAGGLSVALLPLHWALLCGMLLIPLAALAVTRRRWRLR